MSVSVSEDTLKRRKKRDSLTAIELGVCKEADKVSAISRLHVVALEMKRDVLEGYGITIDIQGPYGAGQVFAILLGGLDLAFEVL